MDQLELEAMMIRARVARRFIRERELSAVDGLGMIVAPTKRLLEASLEAARRSGGARDHPHGRTALVTAGLPTPPEHLVTTIDDLVLQLSPGHVRGLATPLVEDR